MPQIQIDAERAERIIAQVLRDEQKINPSRANELASILCTRLRASVRTEAHVGLRGSRIISRMAPRGFEQAVSEKIADVNYRVAAELWELVYQRGRELPPEIATENW